MRDILIPLAILAVFGSILLPLPPSALDFLLAANLIFAIFLFLTALNISEALKLSALPSILLLATLFRLCLNISTTRAILSTGQAGEVVEAFGKTVIGGNVVVGLVIFAIITLVQFIVVAKGAERVAEVSARFALDALPGKQMAIDADVRAGILDAAGAKQKRDELQRESKFYGALDGAMKFVKGDAIAGVFITLINIIGGIAIGSFYHELDFATAVNKFSILSVGDGLLSQLPALLSAVAAGFVVTHVSGIKAESLSYVLLNQITSSAKVCFLGAGVAILLAFAPALPSLPFLIIGGVLIMIPKFNQKNQLEKSAETEIFSARIVPLLEIKVGQEVSLRNIAIPEILKEVEIWRRQVYEETGLVLLKPEFSLLPEKNNYVIILLRGIEIKIFEATKDSTLAVKELIENLNTIVLGHKEELVDDIMTRRLLDNLDREAPELVSATVPAVATVTQITEVLRELLKEGVNLRNFDQILQAICENAEKVTEPRRLLEEVRVKLARVICSKYAKEKIIKAYALEPVLDLMFLRAERESHELGAAQVAELCEKMKELDDEENLVIVSKGARRIFKECLQVRSLKFPVIAHEEICAGYDLKIVDYLEAPEIREEMIEALAA